MDADALSASSAARAALEANPSAASWATARPAWLVSSSPPAHARADATRTRDLLRQARVPPDRPWLPGKPGREHARCGPSKRACLACSRPETSGTARSNASPCGWWGICHRRLGSSIPRRGAEL